MAAQNKNNELSKDEKNKYSARETVKDLLLIGGICFLVSLVCLGVLFYIAQDVDFRYFFYEEASDWRVYLCAGLALAGVILFGMPFIKLPFVGKAFSFLWENITGKSSLVSNVSKDDADYYVTNRNTYEYKGNTYIRDDYEGKWTIIFKTVFAIIGLVIGAVLLYAVGLLVSPFVLIGEIIYVIATR